MCDFGVFVRHTTNLMVFVYIQKVLVKYTSSTTLKIRIVTSKIYILPYKNILKRPLFISLTFGLWNVHLYTLVLSFRSHLEDQTKFPRSNTTNKFLYCKKHKFRKDSTKRDAILSAKLRLLNLTCYLGMRPRHDLLQLRQLIKQVAVRIFERLDLLPVVVVLGDEQLHLALQLVHVLLLLSSAFLRWYLKAGKLCVSLCALLNYCFKTLFFIFLRIFFRDFSSALVSGRRVGTG